jgi:hypothetical protein
VTLDYLALTQIHTIHCVSKLENIHQINLATITEDVNDKHMAPWSDLLKESGIVNSPLTPYLDQELLSNNHVSLEGSKLESVTGFHYSYPNVTEALIREVIDGYKAQNIWPKDN